MEFFLGIHLFCIFQNLWLSPTLFQKAVVFIGILHLLPISSPRTVQVSLCAGWPPPCSRWWWGMTESSHNSWEDHQKGYGKCFSQPYLWLHWCRSTEDIHFPDPSHLGSSGPLSCTPFSCHPLSNRSLLFWHLLLCKVMQKRFHRTDELWLTPRTEQNSSSQHCKSCTVMRFEHFELYKERSSQISTKIEKQNKTTTQTGRDLGDNVFFYKGNFKQEYLTSVSRDETDRMPKNNFYYLLTWMV